MNISKTHTMHHHEESVKLNDELQERQLIEQFNKRCREAIAYARRKHPKFANKVGVHNTYALDILAHEFRECAKEDATVYNVLMSEVAEFLSEIKRGDIVKAQEEASHVVAVMWRALTGEHLASQRGELRVESGEEVTP